MTANRRIFLNIVATYGRSLYALVIGLFCGRWTLMALGEVDYGLMGVVGGLTAFITFLNGIMAGGVGRFYAISVGMMQKDQEKGLEECHRWFTTAVVVHTILPVILMLIGYPIGEWAVRHFLTIPPDRVQSCVWVWRCVCVSTFVGMAGVPFSAWYNAKQEIAELTVYSFVTTTFNVIFLYYALNHPGDWLVPMACWTMLLSVVPRLIICCRAGFKYRECQFKIKFINCLAQVKYMMAYSGWLLVGAFGDLFSQQAMNVLVNKYFGPMKNAAMSVSSSVTGHATSLSGSLLGALWPAIMNACGARDFVQARNYADRACKLAPLLIMCFSIPLIVEMDYVLELWLKNPPQCAAGLCMFALCFAMIDRSTHGYAYLMYAQGYVKQLELLSGIVFLLALPLAWLLLHLGGSVYCVGAALVCARAVCSFMRVVVVKRCIGVPVGHWVGRIALPLVGVAFVSFSLAEIVKHAFEPSFVRLLAVVFVALVALTVFAWVFLMDNVERAYIWQKIRVRFT